MAAREGRRGRAARDGVGLVQLLDCEGAPMRVDGETLAFTAFLVGERVAMTAEHGVAPLEVDYACGARVRVGGEWYRVNGLNVWRRKGQEWRGTDLATIELDRAPDGHGFALATREIPNRAPVTALGYPLGRGYAAVPGTVTNHLIDYSIPTLAVRAEIQPGTSGGPIVDRDGDAVSIVSRIVIWANLTRDGKHRHGGVDLARWWGPSARYDLCHAHPNGGIPNCDDKDGKPKRDWTAVSLPSR